MTEGKTTKIQTSLKYSTGSWKGEDMKLSIQKTAQVLGVSEEFVRMGIQTGRLDIGACVKLGGSKERYTYCVIPTKVARFLGITMDELDRRVNYEPQD